MILAESLIYANIIAPKGEDGWIVNNVESHENSKLMISGIYDAIISGSQNADLVRMISRLIAYYISAELIRITGAIFGGSFNSDGSNPSGGMGFHISKDRILYPH